MSEVPLTRQRQRDRVEWSRGDSNPRAETVSLPPLRAYPSIDSRIPTTPTAAFRDPRHAKISSRAGMPALRDQSHVFRNPSLWDVRRVPRSQN